MWTGSPLLTTSVANIRRKSCALQVEGCPEVFISFAAAIASLMSLFAVGGLTTSDRPPRLRWNRWGSGALALRS
jgi:hypothetical protein